MHVGALRRVSLVVVQNVCVFVDVVMLIRVCFDVGLYALVYVRGLVDLCGVCVAVRLFVVLVGVVCVCVCMCLCLCEVVLCVCVVCRDSMLLIHTCSWCVFLNNTHYKH